MSPETRRDRDVPMKKPSVDSNSYERGGKDASYGSKESATKAHYNSRGRLDDYSDRRPVGHHHRDE